MIKGKKLIAKVKVSYEKKYGEGEKWVQIGVAFVIDEKQINVLLDTVPIRNWDGKFALFLLDEKENEETS